MLCSNQLVLTCALGEALYEITLFRFEGLVFKTEPSIQNKYRESFYMFGQFYFC